MKERKSFWDYITSASKDLSTTDPYQIVMLAQLFGKPITLVYGNSQKWSTYPSIEDNIVLVYKGDGEFLPTDVGIYQYFKIIFWHGNVT